MIIQDHLPRDLFKNKTVFVTGGGSGINLGVASNFAALGANVGICGRTQDKLDHAAIGLRELNAHVEGEVLPVAADVRDPVALASAIARTQSELGPIDVVVAGAAGNFLCPAEELSPKLQHQPLSKPGSKRRADHRLELREQRYGDQEHRQHGKQAHARSHS